MKEIFDHVQITIKFVVYGLSLISKVMRESVIGYLMKEDRMFTARSIVAVNEEETQFNATQC